MSNKYALPIPTREPDGEFSCEQEWVCKAVSWIGGTNALCVDAKDRICAIGGDFMRATAEGTYPIRFWHGAGGETKAEQRKSQAAARRAYKAQYPWRR